MAKFEAMSVQLLAKPLQNLHISIVARTRCQSDQNNMSMFSFPIGSENIMCVVEPSKFIDSIGVANIKNTLCKSRPIKAALRYRILTPTIV